MKRQFYDDTILIEILSRLPIKAVAKMNYICKQWRRLIHTSFFRNIYFQRSQQKGISGLFYQRPGFFSYCMLPGKFDLFDYVSFGSEGNVVKKRTLNFLPEQVIVASSCNGLVLCCSNWIAGYDSGATKEALEKQMQFYVCNPYTKEWLAISGGCTNQTFCGVGFGVSHTSTMTNYKVVVLEGLPAFYTFKIYSSETDSWSISMETNSCDNGVHEIICEFANGVCYWRISGHCVLSFDLENEKSELINLPGPAPDNEGDLICSKSLLGRSEGNLNYIFLSKVCLRVWVLDCGHSKTQWVLSYVIPLWEIDSKWMSNENLDRELPKSAGYNVPNRIMTPFAFQDGILFLEARRKLNAYDLKTGKFEELRGLDKFFLANWTAAVVPYTRSLLPVNKLKNCEQNNGGRERTVSFTNCELYLKAIKDISPGKQQMYNRFTQIIIDMYHQSPGLTKRRVKGLLTAHSDLIKRWNILMPEDYQINLPFELLTEPSFKPMHGRLEENAMTSIGDTDDNGHRHDVDDKIENICMKKKKLNRSMEIDLTLSLGSLNDFHVEAQQQVPHRNTDSLVSMPASPHTLVEMVIAYESVVNQGAAIPVPEDQLEALVEPHDHAFMSEPAVPLDKLVNRDMNRKGINVGDKSSRSTRARRLGRKGFGKGGAQRHK